MTTIAIARGSTSLDDVRLSGSSPGELVALRASRPRFNYDSCHEAKAFRAGRHVVVVHADRGDLDVC